MNVTLVRTAPAPSPSSDAAAGGVRPLVARFDTDTPPVMVSERPGQRPLDQLMRRLETAAAHVPHPAPRPAAAADAAEDAAPHPAPTRGRPGPAVGSARAGSTGGLWGVVEPCWRAVAPGSRVPVTLEVSIDGASRLAAPPAILRPNGARLDEVRLRSEALALNALAECLPRGDLRIAGGFYRLEFRPG